MLKKSEFRTPPKNKKNKKLKLKKNKNRKKTIKTERKKTEKKKNEVGPLPYKNELKMDIRPNCKT